jgi:hypothetical protein
MAMVVTSGRSLVYIDACTHTQCLNATSSCLVTQYMAQYQEGQRQYPDYHTMEDIYTINMCRRAAL